MFPRIARIVARVALPILGVIALASVAAPADAAVIDPLPITPNQFFAGFVNDVRANATLVADCAGVARTGHPGGGQTVSAQPEAPASTDLGFTGSAGRSLVVSLVLSPASAPIPIGTLSGFFVELAIPTSITVPCGGSATMVFAPSPTSMTARSATVSVTIISLGAGKER
jgi:hypothetical protein